MKAKAALYLRSSKDRSDVSIDAQRRQLEQLATDRGYLIVDEYADVVESGKDDQRAGFQSLVRAVRDKKRGWDHVLILDTSRLARRRHISLIFEEVECRKHGVRIIYKSLPDADPITEMLLKSILQAMDEWHSLTSKQKGLAGMAENVRQGWRAGGRAPLGYMLEHVPTGAIRDGSPVVKSRLVVSEDARKVAKYLKLKASGISRRVAMKEAGLDIPDTSAIGIEWNALTYAGHTAWNQRYEFTAGGYTGGVKRRPRSEWVIQHNTHEALITDAEAEQLIAKLENASRNHSRATRTDHLLTGLLRDKEGCAWYGDGAGFYRCGKGKRIRSAVIESTVVASLAQDLRSTDFVKEFTMAAKRQADNRAKDGELPKLRAEMAKLEKQILNLSNLLSETTTPAPLLRHIEQLEQKRAAIEDELAQRAEMEAETKKIRSLTEAHVAKIMDSMAEDIESLERDRLKEFVRGMLEKIELDVANATVQLVYRLNAGFRLASPRGFEPRYSP